MSRYWDEKHREVNELMVLPLPAFREAVAELEERVAHRVSLVTGDREFPDDLRQKLQGILACNCLRPLGPVPNPRPKEWLETMGYSKLFEELHRAFHEVAERHPPNRYSGYFTDDPEDFLKAREAQGG